ncbi:MAG: signal peptidase I, partial [Finegoldia magna]|nr:signal peptidase I [Finegoldia magna]
NMSPTLTSGDFVLINKLNKITGYIKKTDIVKYYDEKNSESSIARVIAMPKDSVEIINDDRELDNYNDSRYIGPINKDSIIGVVFFRLYPVDKIGSI